MALLPAKFICNNRMRTIVLGMSCLLISLVGFSQQNVTWFDVLGYSVQTDNSLLKTGNSGEGNSGAISANILNAGGAGWMELTVDDPTASYAFGFHPEIGSIADFHGFRRSSHTMLFEAGRVVVMENGSVLSIVQGVKQGDNLKMEVSSGVLYYSVNKNIVKTTTTSKTAGQLLFAEVFTKNDVMPPLVSTFGLQYLIELDMTELDLPMTCDVLLNGALKFVVSDTGIYNAGFIPTGSDLLTLEYSQNSSADIILTLGPRHNIENVELLSNGHTDDMNTHFFQLYNSDRGIKFVENNPFPDSFDDVNYYELNLEYGMTLKPNDTQFNELKLVGVPSSTNADIEVFNADRQVVFSSQDFNNESWDGKVNYSVIPGNYTYSMRISGVSVSGQFIIVK